MDPLSHQILADVWVSERFAEKLNDLEFVKRLAEQVALATKSTILKIDYHLFEPQGISVIVFVAESHVAIHTYPEESYLSVDIFTCGKTWSLAGLKELIDIFGYEIKSVNARIVTRGEKHDTGL